MSLYRIVSSADQQFAIDIVESKIVIKRITSQTPSWEARFTLGNSMWGIAFVNNGQAIAFNSNNQQLFVTPYNEGNDSLIWISTPHGQNNAFTIANPIEGDGQIWDIHGGNLYDGCPVYTWNHNSGANQLWLFSPA